MSKRDTKGTISQSLDKLEAIVQWFDEQESVQVEEGLQKVRDGAALIQELRGRLKTVENEFEELKKELDADDSNQEV